MIYRTEKTAGLVATSSQGIAVSWEASWGIPELYHDLEEAG
jgi:hypothetical protein